MVLTIHQFAVGDRVRALPIKPTDAHLWGKQGVVQSGQRANGTLTVNLDGGKLRAFRPNELEPINEEAETDEQSGNEIAGDREAATRAGDGGDRKARRRKTSSREKVPDAVGRPGTGADAAQARDEMVSGGAPTAQPGALVKTPGGLRAYVVGPDPKDSERVLIDYEAKHLGSDRYSPQLLTLIHPAPERQEVATVEYDPTTRFEYGERVRLHWKGETPRELIMVAPGAIGVVREKKVSGSGRHERVQYRLEMERGGFIWVLERYIQEVEEEEEAAAISGRKVRQQSPFAETYEAEAKAIAIDNNQSTIIETSPESITESLDEEISRIYREASEAEDTAIAASKAAAQLYFELGSKLLQRRATLKHGEWLPYLEGRGIHKRKAQRAIQLFKEFDGKSDTLTHLTLTEALQEASKKPEEEPTLEPSPQTTQKDLGESMDRIEQGIEQRKAAALDYGPGVAPETAQALAEAGVVPCKPSITPEEFNREIWGESGPPILDRRSCKNCANQIQHEGSGFTCNANVFEGVSRHPVSECSRFNSRVIDLPKLEPPKGLSMLEAAVWGWLNFHRYEADEDAVKDAAIAINEFLQGQFLEVNEDE